MHTLYLKRREMTKTLRDIPQGFIVSAVGASGTADPYNKTLRSAQGDN